MKLADQWRRIEAELPADWDDAELALELEDPGKASRAAALLGPANPRLAGDGIRFSVSSTGAAQAPEAVRRMLARLDSERIGGTLELRGAGTAPAEAPEEHTALVEAWDAALASLPPDWSDLYCEVEPASSDQLDRAALLLAPLNPARPAGKLALRFRVASSFGYGASPGMARRCLQRVDEAGIRGTASILRSLSGSEPNQTQGPVWYVEGKAV